MHKRSINSKCLFVDAHMDSDSQSDKSPTASGGPGQSYDNDLNLQILAELKSLGGRMTAMEQRMSESDSAEVTSDSSVTCSGFSSRDGSGSGTVGGSVSYIQAEVDQ